MLPVRIFTSQTRRVSLASASDSARLIYEVGSHMGCGCASICELDGDNVSESDLKEWRASREDFRRLADYLTHVIPVHGPVELYNAEDYWKPPGIRRLISIHDLLQERFTSPPAQLCWSGP